MWLTKLAIERRVTIAMVIAALLVLGLVGLSRMPWDLAPDVDFPMVTVTVAYPGAGPEEVEQRILRPLEDQVSSINGVTHVQATGYENAGTIAITFDYSITSDVAAADVRDAVDRARASFPDEAKQPSIYKIDINARPVLVVGITSAQRSPSELRKLVDDEIKTTLGQVQGVASVSVSGGEQREIQVLVHRDRLDAVGMSISKLASVLAAQDMDIPSGSIKEGRRDYSVRILGQIESLDVIRDLRIKTDKGGLVPLSSLAEVRDTVVDPDGYARVDGSPAVAVSIVKQSGSNTVKVVQGARKELEHLLGSLAGDVGGGEKAAATGHTTGVLPADIKAVVASDSSERVIESIMDVRDALLFGAFLAAIVVFLFLHNLRGTIIVAIAIPTSMLATFLPIGLGFGFTLNMMVMLGLSLAVGILVDDSIVVLENVEKHLHRGEEPRAAAFNGRTEIGGAAVGITMVDVVVFIPIAMMSGIVGRFFRPFGITSFVVTLFSLFMSFTLTPMLTSWWYSRRTKDGDGSPTGLAGRFFAGWDRGYAAVERTYARVLRGAIRHPYIVVGSGYLILILVVAVIGKRLPFEFLPASDAGQISISIEAAVGTRLEQTDVIAREIEARLSDKSKYPEVAHISARVGSSGSGILGGGNTGGQYGQVDVTLTRRRARVNATPKQRSDQELCRDLRTQLADIPGVVLKTTPADSMGGGGGADVELNILCENQELLSETSAKLAQEVAKVPGLLYVDLSAKPGRPEVHASIDRLRASDLGLTVAEIGAAVRAAVDGNTGAKFRESGDEYDIRVQYERLDRQSVLDVGNIFVGLGRDDQPVWLRDVADITMSTGPSRVERYNRQRMVTLSASLDRRVLRSGGAQQAIDAILKASPMPGVATRWTGTIERQTESFGNMGQALLLAIGLVYIVTAALYNNLLQPFNIMFTIPMALVGGLLGLAITGNALSIVAMIGVIQLTGLVGKNAILVVDFTNTLRARGIPRTEAILQAGPARMRPVLMTTMAAICGALPTALAVNEGSEWRAPMAIVVIFGLAVATMLSLLVVPCTYIIWDQIGVFIARLGRGLTALITGRRSATDTGKGKTPPPDDNPPPKPLPPLPPPPPPKPTDAPAAGPDPDGALPPLPPLDPEPAPEGDAPAKTPPPEPEPDPTGGLPPVPPPPPTAPEPPAPSAPAPEEPAPPAPPAVPPSLTATGAQPGRKRLVAAEGTRPDQLRALLRRRHRSHG